MKDEECAKLLKVRDQIGEELEELTASLFEVGSLTDIPLGMIELDIVEDVLRKYMSVSSDLTFNIIIMLWCTDEYRLNIKD